MKSIKNCLTLLLCIYLLLFLAGCREIENQKTNQLNKILNDGNAALLAKQYDKAIEFYDAGLAVIPNEPVFLGNKATALRLRGADTYNNAIRTSDKKDKDRDLVAAKNDFRESAKLSNQALIQLKNVSFVDSLFSKSMDELKLNAYSSYADSMRLLATTVDKTKAADALEASREYTALETDKQKKLKARLDTGKMLIDTLNGEKAIVEYENILKENPDQPDALFGLGSALAQTGKSEDVKKAKSSFEEFLKHAPADHPSIATAQEIIKSL